MTSGNFAKIFLKKTAAVILSTFSLISFTMPHAHASQSAIDTFHLSAYSGEFKSGINSLDIMATKNPDDVEAIFAKGTLQFFGAIANLQQGFYNHSLETTAANKGLGWARSILPIPLLPSTSGLLPINPDARPMTYASLREILTTFDHDLKEAEATLAKVGKRPTKLPLQPFKIAIDLNHDGTIMPSEQLMGAVLGGMRRTGGQNRLARLKDVTVVFDTADASWLRGYSNLLMATTNMFLAFDFEKSYEVIAHNFYGPSATRFGQELEAQRQPARAPALIQAEIDEVAKKLEALTQPKNSRTKLRLLQKQLRLLPRTKEYLEERKLLNEARTAIINKRREFHRKKRALRKEQRQLANELKGQLPSDQFSEIFDLVAYIHSLNWTVIEPQRLKAVRTHLLNVAELNHVTWQLVRAETDDDREWLPNAAQTSPFGARRLTDNVIDGWLATMDLSAEVLQGKKLLPHPRFEKGINLKKFFETAKEVDFVFLITGHGLIPYLEEGEIVDAKAWAAVTAPLGRDLPLFALWFN